MAVLEVPVTVPFSEVDCPSVSELEVGLRATDMVGSSAIVAVAALEGSTTLVAIIITFCGVLRVAGTV